MRWIRFFIIVMFFLSFPVFYSSGGGEKSAAEKEAEEKEEEVEPTPVTIPEETQAPEVEEPGEAIIKGRLLDEFNNPISGVSVSCIDKNGEPVADTVTDENGEYEFKNLDEGEYTVSVNYSGFSSPIEIQFEESRKRPLIPTGLKVFEIGRDISDSSYVKAQWDKMPDVIGYRCEIYVKGEKEPLIKYPDIIHNSCEFGNLKENTDYQVRIYSKNRFEYSTSYALGSIRTIDKSPLAPFGLGVVHAKNHRVDLIWNRIETDYPVSYIIQIKKGKDSYLFYSKEGLVADKKDAFIIEAPDKELIGYSISDRLEDGTPLIDNLILYSFRVHSVDENGTLSKPSTAVERIALDDTVPPRPPANIKYEFIDEDRLKISWESKDRDIAKYRIYYGVNKDRWDGIAYSDKNSYELIINRRLLKNEDLYVTITAIDRAGNESGYKPLVKKTEVFEGREVTEDFILSFDEVFKDFSVAIKEPLKKVKKKETVKKKVIKKVVKPREYGFSHLEKKGFVIEKGEKATLNGKISVPENTVILVNSGGTLIVKGAEIFTEEGIWGGIRFLEGSNGNIQNVIISDAHTGVAVINNERGVRFSNVEIKGCKENGLYIKDSKADMTILTIRDNKTGIFLENSEVGISNSYIEDNEKGILAYNFNFTVEDSQFKNNKVYGLRLYGGGTIKRCSFTYNYVGVAIEEGRGSAVVLNSRIEENSIDGIVVKTSALEIRNNLISNNGRNGIYVKEKMNPTIIDNDIIHNNNYAVTGGGKITRCFVAYNNGSTYIDDTREKGRPDNIFSSSSSGMLKQIFNVDYIKDLSYSPVLQ